MSALHGTLCLSLPNLAHVPCEHAYCLVWVCPFLVPPSLSSSPTHSSTFLSSLVHSKDQPPSFTHIIIDEVHGRTVDGDLLCLVIKNLLHKWRGQMKVILMSATLQVGHQGDPGQGATIGDTPASMG